ncbi:hypothetical protein ZIOFF_004961 [Zingiber officinale]|uniref:Uncharacterized protein n=1 Tax=Zingiber officinale TaxID=94328 RepID=A0A8J5HMW9_ZINOF|nr:hypothetical protein ZIOFF_004961 [Zingiber officinale]
MAPFSWTKEDVLRCCGSKRFTKELASTSLFSDLRHAIQFACGIWFNKVTPLSPSSLLSITLADPFPHLLILQIDVVGWLEAFAAHPPIGSISPSVSQWSKEEQSAVMATANDTTLQDSPTSPSAVAALARTTDGPANDEGNLSDAKGLAKEVSFLFQNRRFWECVEILSPIFDKKRGDAKTIILYHIHEYAQSLSVLKKLFQNIEPIEELSVYAFFYWMLHYLVKIFYKSQ